jgi:hypothetical protein
MPTVTRQTLRDYFPDGGFGRRVQPMPDHGCIYVKNAKAGTSTVMLWLQRIHTGDHEWSPETNIHREHDLPPPKDVGWDAIARMLAGDAFRFSFVRDPVQRAESAYLDKVATMERRPRWRLEVQRVLGLPEDPDEAPTFEQFVAALEAQPPLEMDAHWRPQHLNLMHGLVEYDLVGRLESFNADLERVREATGMPVVPRQVRNARPPADSLFDERPELLARVREVYARDLELYGY